MAPVTDSFGDLVGGMGMSAPVQPVAVTNGEAKVEDPIDMSPGNCGYITIRVLLLKENFYISVAL